MFILSTFVFADNTLETNNSINKLNVMQEKRDKHLVGATTDFINNGQYIELTDEEYEKFVMNIGENSDTSANVPFSSTCFDLKTQAVINSTTTKTISSYVIKGLGVKYNVEQVINIYTNGSFGQITAYNYSPPRTYLTGYTIGISLSDKGGYSTIASNGQSIYVKGTGVIHYSIIINGVLEFWSENVSHSFTYSL
ncbi:MAG: hypothetical protein Q7I98_02545 [Erysipelotrichaceae bacterium]|nr:hypothetical protein [Erysipelotrichaceae bacterium]